jgi:hypothetical protein
LQHVPSFCKKFAEIGTTIHHAIVQYRDEVREGAFPSTEHSPYKMSEKETKAFEEMLQSDESERLNESTSVEKKLKAQDEYEAIKLY